MRIVVGADHRGYQLKEALKARLEAVGVEVADVGTQSDTSVDYPDFGLKVAEAVVQGEADRGLLVCSTGVGMSVSANKVEGVIAALCTTVDQGCQARQHLDANVLCLGADVTPDDTAAAILDAWLGASFQGGRHQRRREKILAYDRDRPLGNRAASGSAEA
jgi:ribose 5-phosphate isomerase B